MLETDTQAPPAARTGSVRRFYLFQLASEAKFDSAIWIIYLQSRGYSLGEIGLAESSFHLAPVLLELPSGSFADLVGRRWSLATGAALVAISTALLWAAPNLPLVMLALFLSGASYSFRSGADQAYLYEAIGGDGAHDRYAGTLGRVLGAAYTVGAVSTWLGAALSERSYGLPFGLAIGAGLAGVWLAAGLAETSRERHAPSVSASVRRHVAEARAALARRPAVAAILLLSAAFWTASTIAHLYLQAAFAARGLSNGAIGLIAGVTLLLSAGGAAITGRIARAGRFGRQFSVLAALAGMGLIGAAAGNVALAIAAYLGSQVAYGLAEPLLSAWFNRQIPSAQRATLLSVDSWLFSVMMIVAFPAAGVLAERLGWGTLYVLCGGLTIAVGLAVPTGLRLRGSGAPAPVPAREA